MTTSPSETDPDALDVERPDFPLRSGPVRYTIGTLVTDRAQYREMAATFRAAGFGPADCEFLIVDNTAGNRFDAYAGLNAVLARASGTRVILCHQDVRLRFDDRAVLDRRLAELSAADPGWAVAGNAGMVKPGVAVRRITDPHGENQRVGRFPARVGSLDENFLVLRREAGLRFSHDLAGFHFYGTDICLMAALSGLRAYVIDFHLHHLSGGRPDAGFHREKAVFARKWSAHLTGRVIATTCTLVPIGGAWREPVSRLLSRLSLSRLVRRMRPRRRRS